MNTLSKDAYEKVTLTLPQVVVVELKMVPRGQRSQLVASAVREALRRRKLKTLVEHLRRHPVDMKVRRGGWRETKSLDF